MRGEHKPDWGEMKEEDPVMVGVTISPIQPDVSMKRLALFPGQEGGRKDN